MCTSDEELPFFPSYESLLINDDNLRVVWFEPAFSQSHYNTGKTTNGSNACTIIAILVAAKVHFNGTRVKKLLLFLCSTLICRFQIYGPDKFNTEMVYVLGHCMVEGNKMHETLKSKGSLNNINLTVPEAIKYAGKSVGSLTEWV